MPKRKIKTNKKLIILIILLFLLTITNILSPVVKAENETDENLQKYTLEGPAMYISIDKNMIDLVSGLKNNDQRLQNFEKKEEYLNYYEQSGIIFDAVESLDESNPKEIIVVESNNKAYLSMPNLNQFSEEDLNTYYSQFINSVKLQAESTQIEIQKDEIYKTQNGNVYFHIISQGKIGEKDTKLSTYYTIMNQKLVTIGIRYFNTEIDKEESKTIEQITFDNLPRDNSYIEESNRITKTILAIIIIFILAIMAIRNKDAKKINEEIKDKEIISFSKFGGVLTLLWILSIYQVYLRIIDIISIANADGELAYKIIVGIQCLIIVLLNIYIAIRILIRKPKSVKHIKISLIVNGVLLIISTIIGIIITIIEQGSPYPIEYYVQEISYLLYNEMYFVIWILYMTFSQRVKIYYYIENTVHYITFSEIFKKAKVKFVNIKNKLKNKKEKNDK